MPELELTQLNIVLSASGAFLIIFGVISYKLKKTWFLGDALPATLMGIILGPMAAKLIDPTKWTSEGSSELGEITRGVCRVVIGIQLVIVGVQLPAKYQLSRWKEKLIGMMPVMTVMWLSTSLCVFSIIPNLTLLGSLVIGSCLACTDPILSRAIAKGAFAEAYIPDHLRDMMTSEAGANDSFAFPALMLATYLIRHAVPSTDFNEGGEESADGVGKIGGGVDVALKAWFLETWLYTILLGIVYGAVVGYASCLVLKLALRRRWIDPESFFLFPTAIGLFILGTGGAIGTEDLLACFVAGNALNWNGIYQEECSIAHDSVNPTVCSFLNLGGFLYLGAVMPWDKFSTEDISYGRLFALGLALQLVRRVPATMISYKLLPSECSNPREALVLGYMGPIGSIGIGAIFLAERALELFPELGEGDEEETNLVLALTPVVYWLVLFSVVIHGLSVPFIDFVYRRLVGVPRIRDEKIDGLPFSETTTLMDEKDNVEKRETIAFFGDLKGKESYLEPKSPLTDDKRSLDVSEVRYKAQEWV